MTEVAAIAAGAALTALLLAGSHLWLWETRSGLWLVWRYAIGVAALNAGCTLSALLLNDIRLAVVPWCIAGAGGLVVACLHLWRERQDSPAATALLRRVFREYSHGREARPDTERD